MELLHWLSLASICILGAMTPGPSLAVVLKHTISGSRKNGVYASVFHGLGVSIYAVLTVLGMAIIIKETPWLFNLIRYSGIAFLLWLSFKALTTKSTSSGQIANIDQPSFKKSAYEGFMIAFLNPKLALFFLALFSQFINESSLWQQKMIMVLTVGGIDTLWYCLIALVFSQSKMIDKLKKNTNVIEKVTGVALLLVATKIFFS
ncbi:LysE family translocator [Candidatus Colwellia aromaticivorans]|uniref:LysE family translocator n=1 Tax=Candidatus Colwellia aromaticivorans TaxID=2267621 RepID=UPI000DF37F97|nr:LysE family translocator [Candidatus Colwellia aromaticivorans]